MKERSLVVMIHGFLGTRLQQVPMASRLSKKHDVFNYGYRSRMDTLRGHAKCLVDAVESRVGRDTPDRVHFVTHSFGGVVLHRAFMDGLMDMLPGDGKGSRAVLLGPPLRGSMVARAFQRDKLGLKGMSGDVIHAAARLILGGQSGMELMTKDAQWFERETGVIPEEVDMLVVAGAWGGGVLNPLVHGESDGVVGVSETMMRRKHARVKVPFEHNYLLHSGQVMDYVSRFLDGISVGHVVDGTGMTGDADGAKMSSRG